MGASSCTSVGLPAFAQSGETEINAKGGVLGRKLEPVIVDPASNWPLFAEKTKQLLTQRRTADQRRGLLRPPYWSKRSAG